MKKRFLILIILLGQLSCTTRQEDSNQKDIAVNETLNKNLKEFIDGLNNITPPREICSLWDSTSATLTKDDSLFSFFKNYNIDTYEDRGYPNPDVVWAPIEFHINEEIQFLGKIQYSESIVALFLRTDAIACFCIDLKTNSIVSKNVLCYTLGNIHGHASVKATLINNYKLQVREEQCITNHSWDEGEKQSEPEIWEDEYEWVIINPDSVTIK